MGQRPQHAVKRLAVAVVAAEEPDLYIRPPEVLHLPERQRSHLRPPHEGAREHAADGTGELVLRLEGVGELALARRPARPVREEGVMPHRVDRGVATAVSGVAGVHGGSAVDDIGVAAARQNDVGERGSVKLAGGVEVEVELVGLDGGFEVVVEVVGEVEVGAVEVAERVEVLLEFG